MRGSQINSREQHGELGGLKLNTVLSGLGHLETPGLEPLIPDGQPIAIEIEDLEPISAAIEKEEEMAAQGVLPEAVLNESRSGHRSSFKINRPCAKEDPDRRREHDHGVVSLCGRVRQSRNDAAEPFRLGQSGEAEADLLWQSNLDRRVSCRVDSMWRSGGVKGNEKR